MGSVAEAVVVVLMVLQTVALTKATTDTPTTIMCPMVTCGYNCGYTTGSDGCLTCECHPTCLDVSCGPQETCIMQDIQCDQPMCFPAPICIPNGTTTESTASLTPTQSITATTPDPCTGTPNTGRCSSSFILRWTYNSVTDKCEKFSYYGCTPSPNTFSSTKACRNRCKAACKVVVCKDNCYAFTKKNGCTKCICPNPCKGFECPTGYKCRLQESKLVNKVPEPFCYLKP